MNEPTSNSFYDDPDAIFRPFVTPYMSTHPDNNCGKGGDA
jgi:hypothetical protein